MDGKKMSLREQLSACSNFMDVFWNLIPGGIGVFECTGGIRPIYLSAGVRCLSYGFDDELYKKADKNIDSILLEPEREKLRKEVQNAIGNHLILDCVVGYKKTPEKTGWVWVRGKLADSGGRRNIIIAVILDVSARKQLENELMMQNERYRMLEETSGEILFEVNLEEDVFTYSHKEVNGELKREKISPVSVQFGENPMVHPDYMDIFMQHMTIARQGQTKGKLEYLSKISGRGYEWHRINYRSLEDEFGCVTRIIGRIGNIHDEVLSRQKKREEIEFGLNHIGGVKKLIWEALENSDFDDTHYMAIVSINNFKRITAQNGVAWGDEAVRKLARFLRGLLNGQAVMGRSSDGEMLLYFKNISEEEMDSWMRRILSGIKVSEYQVAGLMLECTIGASAMQGIVDYTAFYQEAEEALYIAKITRDEDYIRV